LRALKRSLRNNKGLTLIEIMMALAVFGIIIVVFATSIGAYHRINAGNLDEMRMIELARAVTESIKGDPDMYSVTDNTYDPAEVADTGYPYKTDSPEQTYSVKIYKPSIAAPSGKMLKVTVGPKDSPDPDNETENYTLVSWLPDTKIKADTERINEETEPYEGSSWNNTSNNEPSKWTFSATDGIFNKPEGAGSEKLIYYEGRTYKTFDYMVYPEIKDALDNKKSSGIAILSAQDITKYYIFCLYNEHADKLVYGTEKDLFESGNYTFELNKQYYLEVIGKSDNSLTLKFGECDADKKPLPPVFEYVDYSTSGFYNSGNEYYLGLYDDTSGSKVVFTLPKDTILGCALE